MKKHAWINKAGHLALAAACMALALMAVPPAVLADDTDVFFPPTPVSGSGSKNPNILFIIDDSTSMSGTDNVANGPTRLKRVQDAFSQVMDDMNASTNVGVMRFSKTEGGAVIFPVAPIESLIADVHSSFAIISQVSQIASGSHNEAEQIVGSGTVTRDQSPISFGYKSVLDMPLTQEAEEDNNNTRTYCSTDSVENTSCGSSREIQDKGNNTLDLNKVNDQSSGTGTGQWVGLRFGRVPLPTDFTASDARLVFTSDGEDLGPLATLRIWGVKNNASTPYADTTNDSVSGGVDYLQTPTAANNKPTTNSGGGTGYINWPNVPTIDDSERLVSPNIAELVNEIKKCNQVTVNTVLAANASNGTNQLTLPTGVTMPYNGAVINFPNASQSYTVTGFPSANVVSISPNMSGTKNTTSLKTINYLTIPPAQNPCSTDWMASPTANRNTLMFMISGNPASGQSRRRAKSRSSAGSNFAPKLSIAYTSPTQAAPQTIVGLRFPGIEVPKGVNITNAFIRFNQDALGGAGKLRLKIYVENPGTNYTTAEPATFGTSNNSVTSRTWDSTPVLWDVPVWDKPLTTQTSIDVKDLVDRTVKRDGWCGGKSIAFKIEVDTGASVTDPDAVRRAISATMDDSLAPTLIYSYSSTDPSLVGGCAGTSTTNVQIAAAVDDAAENPIGGTPVLTGPTSIGLGCATATCSASAQVVGLRFAGVPIPVGSTITSAVIDFKATNNESNVSGTVTFRGQLADDAPGFTEVAGDLNDRYVNRSTSASSSKFWSNWNSGNTYSTDNLKDIVQEIVNRSGWSQGNSIAFLIKGDGRHRFSTYDASTKSNAPKLKLTFKTTVGKLTVRNYLKRLVYGLTPYSYTPSVETLYEAAKYMRGETAYYGLTRGFGPSLPANPQDYDAFSSAPNLNVSHPGTFKSPEPTHVYPPGCITADLTNTACALETYTSAGTYKSPINDSCQQNNIVFLTDGLPNSLDDASISRVRGMINNASCPSAMDGQGTCAAEIAGFLYNNDQSSAYAGIQRIRTFTVGLAIPSAKDWLTSIATAGGGQYFTANTAADLVTAFQAIISSILDVDTTFVAPAVTVNTFNRLTNRNELYFALFKPNLTVNWVGNLKRYQLKENTAAGAPDIYDKNNQLAVDAATGFFKDAACSYWTATCPDGPQVELGGVAAKLGATRKVLTYLGTGTTSINYGLTGTPLANVSETDLEVPATDKEKLVNWALGADAYDDDNDTIDDEARKVMGDPLHSEPTLISYGGTEAAPDLAVFVGDNQGYLHAFNADSSDALGGNEYFSFIPKELLKNLKVYADGSGGYKDRPYGMDGSLTTYIKDVNKDGTLAAGTDKAILYAGMHRGGKNYYALDVTTRTAPVLKWVARGGSSGNLTEMGQTWAGAQVASIRFNNTDYGDGTNPPVVILAGGYDEAQDSKTNLFNGGTRQGDGSGRAIYVLNAETGALLWWAGLNASSPNLPMADMVYSIPAAPQAVDLDADGYVDRIYVADAGGQVFRIILGKDGFGKPSLSNATGSMIAKLSVAGIPGSRHFFNTPDVALITDHVASPFIAISIGSGHRERPLDTTTEDRFYILKDPDLNNDGTPSALLINGDADLYDATGNLAGSADSAVAAQAKADIAAKKGLYIKLGTGEKALTDSTTFNNQVLFATFKPGVAAAANSCQATQGESRFYRINIADGTPVQDLNGDNQVTVEDRSKVIPVAGLPPDPVILFPSIRVITHADGTKEYVNDGGDGALVDPIVLIGAVRFNLNARRQVQKSWWRQN